MLNSFPAVSSMYMNSALLNLSSDSLTIHVPYRKILLLPFLHYMWQVPREIQF